MKTGRLCELDVRAELKAPWQPGFRDFATCPNPITNLRPDLADIIRTWYYYKPPFIASPAMKKSVLYQWEMEIQDVTSRPGPFILPKRTLPCTCGSGLPYGACCAGK
jgi:hypothetical protein